MNTLWPGSCPIITMRSGPMPDNRITPLLQYPATGRRSRFSLPRTLKEDIRSGRHRLEGIVLHGMFNPIAVRMGAYLKKIGVPYLFIPHDPYVAGILHHSRLKKLLWWHLFEKRFIENAVALQLLDESHEEPLRKLGCHVRTFVIPNGCEIATASQLSANARIPGSGNPIRLQFLGRMDRNHKGLDLLLEGFALYLKSPPADARPVELFLSGNDWHDRKELEELASRLGITGSVVFTGRRDESSVAIFSEADIAILSSRFDGFGLCIIEAMLAGRPVLVSERAGVATHVRKAGGGWCFPPRPEAIADAIRTAIGERARWPEIGEANHRYVTGHLSWEQIARQTAEAYRQIFSKA